MLLHHFLTPVSGTALAISVIFVYLFTSYTHSLAHSHIPTLICHDGNSTLVLIWAQEFILPSDETMVPAALLYILLFVAPLTIVGR